MGWRAASIGGAGMQPESRAVLWQACFAGAFLLRLFKPRIQKRRRMAGGVSDLVSREVLAPGNSVQAVRSAAPRRRRTAPPTSAKPPIIVSQLAGSGTAVT